jgi:anti-sigma regulatory factor (Ser/Thr protein kinase)
MGLQTALLVLTCVVLVGITVFLVADRSAANEGEQAVRSASANVDKPQEAPRGVVVVVEKGGRRLSSPELPEGFPIEADMTAVRKSGVTREHLVHFGHDRYLVRTERVGDRVNQAIYDQEEYEAERHRLQVALFSAGGLGVLLSALAGVVLAWRSLRPLAQSLAMQRRFVAADTRTSISHDEVDVGVVVAEAVASAAATAQELGKELSVTGEDQAVVRGSESSLRRAVIALVDNALDHASSAVSVDVRADRGTCAIAVSDDGPGIDAEVLPRMFQRFASARESATTRRHYGLGLALVADVADAHGGRVSAAPREDGPGAVLTLSLPLA